MFFHKLLEKYRVEYLDRRLVFLMDLLLSVASTLLILFLAAFFTEPDMIRGPFFWVCLCSSVLSTALMQMALKSYSIIIRHTTIKDVFIFSLLALGKVVLIWAVLFVSGLMFPMAFMMLLVDFILTTLLYVMMRIDMIFIYDLYKSRVREIQKCTRVLVYGTSDKSVAALSRLKNSSHYDIMGFISPDSDAYGANVMDKTIFALSSSENFDNLSKSLSLGGILFTRDADVKAEQDRLIRYCINLNIKTLLIPEVSEMTDGRLENFRVRDVKIEDLLGRDEIKISEDEIRSDLTGKVVLVTGAAGSIGSEFCRLLTKFDIARLILLDNAETPMHNLRLELEETRPGLSFVPVIGDVRHVSRLDFVFRSYKPQVVFHAAAYKHVPLMEENPCEAVLVNVIGSRNVADKCIEYGVEKMVMVSTDKAVNPTNIMGCSKRLAEIYVQSLGLAVESGELDGFTKFVTTRFGNVLGSNGSVIPRFTQQIEKGGPVTVTHPEITRFFMTIPEACRLVLEAASLPVNNKICIFDMGESVKIDTLARRMIELSGLKPDEDIRIVYTGLRPGEKLYEEVLSKVEDTFPTTHNRIRIAEVRNYPYTDARQVVEKLEMLSSAVKIPEMVMLMKQVVPEFLSNNSSFSVYDSKQ